MIKVLQWIGVTCVLQAGWVQAAADIDQLQNAAQGDFRALSEDMGAAFSYKAMAPAAPLGLTGFDVGVVLGGTTLENEVVFENVTSGDAPSFVPVPKLQVMKGLPFNLDVGAMYVGVPGTDIRLFGGELRWALIEGGIATPAVGLRATMTKLDGVDQLDFKTRSLDISVSKGFAFLTPYAGIGRVWTVSSAHDLPPPAALTEEKFSLGKVYAGVGMKFLLMNLVFEFDKTGDASSYAAKFGMKF